MTRDVALKAGAASQGPQRRRLHSDGSGPVVPLVSLLIGFILPNTEQFKLSE